MEPVSKKTGTYYRKERARKVESEKVLVGKMKPLQSFIVSNINLNQQHELPSVVNDTEKNSVKHDEFHQDIIGNEIAQTETKYYEHCPPSQCSEQRSPNPIEETVVLQDAEFLGPIDDDPTKWPVKNPNFIQHFLRNRPAQCPNQLNFSNSKREYANQARYCNRNFFFKKKVNGEIIQRQWMHYSHSLGKIFCVYCKIFSVNNYGSFICDGFNDWKHPKLIEDHENAKAHRSSVYTYATRLRDFSALASALEKQILDERKYWIDILQRIVNVIKFSSARGLPFRGNDEHIGSSGNGNYLGILELLAEHDPLLRQHIEKNGNKGRGSVSYLSSTIADEIITILAKEVRDVILKAILLSKYFSLIVDSTPDVAHVDQLTICIRYVNDRGVAVERFLVFLPNTGHKGTEMESAVLDYMKLSGIVILDCRGQSYDNAKNMSGIYKGLQAKIKQICPLAEYVPCSTHSLNLTLEHAAEDNAEVARFFLFVQNIYVFFAASTKRWSVLLYHLKNGLTEKQRHNPQERLLVPKKLSDSRWSARTDACRALKTGYNSFASALKGIFEDPEEKKTTQIEAEALYKDFFKLETAFLLIFWSTILLRANVTSKSLQNPWIDIETSTSLYKSLSTYIASLRNEESFNIFIDQAKDLISGCPDWEEQNQQLNFNCYEKRISKRNTRYDSGKSRETVFSDCERFRISIFYSSLDSMISDLATQVEAYETVLMPFSFMFKLDEITDPEISEGCAQLIRKYVNDLDDDFVNECIHFKFFMADINAAIEKDRQRHSADKMNQETETMNEASDGKSRLISKPSRMLKYIWSNNLDATFPNLEVAHRIFESIAVANATGERSFSGLKRIKSPLRSLLNE